MINRILLRFGCAALLAGMLAAQPALAQDKKVALVIGNSEYKNVFPLKNPVNDATDIAAALARVGFVVTTLNNAPVADMKRTLKAFGDKAKLSEVALVFYSGHALQSDGVVWLLASDGQARSLADVARSSVSLPEIVEQMDGAEKIGMVFVDAARNDPFNEAQKRQLPSGLKRQVEEPRNVLLSFATGAGRKVGDGEGRNSPFTAALLKHIEEPGLEIIALMKRVRDDVRRATGNEQVPSFYISADDEAYFVAALPKPEPQPAPAPIPAPQPAPEAAPAPPVVAPETPAAPAPAPQAAVPPAPPAAPEAPAPAPAAPVVAPAPEPVAPADKAAEAPQAPQPAPAPAPEAEKPAAEPAPANADAGREGSDSTEKKSD